MMIDNMAERYGQLPSTIINEATTFDLFICDTAIGYKNMIDAEARGETTKPKLTQDQMKAALDRVKKESDGKISSN